MKRKGLKVLLGGISISVVAVLLMSFGDFSAQCKAVRKGVLRLHIIARSDSEEDQAEKLRIRDRILCETGELFSVSDTKENCMEIAKENMDRIIACAKEETGDSAVYGEIVNMYFETRVYDDITLPAGRYDAVRITVGEGKGHNWWCVLFPGLCIPGCSVSEENSNMLKGMNNDIPGYTVKFWAVEVIEKIKEYFSS